MSRRPDTASLGRSKRAPFVPGETPSERHDRRLHTALTDRRRLETWLEARGLALVVGNDDQHWQIRRDGALVAEWWPSSAKAVIGRRYSKGVHCHDVDQLRDLIAGRLLRSAR